MKKSVLLSERIKNYSLCTSAILASALLADAQVIYTDADPDILVEGSDYGTPDIFGLDLNNDGISEFEITSENYFYNVCYAKNFISIYPFTDNSWACSPGGPSVLSTGDTISEGLSWKGYSGLMAYRFFESEPCGSSTQWFFGNWLGENEKYMGLRFKIDGVQHYGWVRLTSSYLNVIIHDYAYEATPGAAIIPDGCNGITVFADADGDGYGDLSDSYLTDCVIPSGYVSNSSDCNDNNSQINPGACDDTNGVDDNCDGEIDFGGGAIFYYADEDGDGYGGGIGTALCNDPGAGYANNSNDCNDSNALVNPSAIEICDGIDNNCDGSIDPLFTFYADADNDGYGNSNITILDCISPAGYVADNTDCDDNNALVNPSVIEVCDGIDNNCEGNIDEGVLITYYVNADGDFYGNPDISTLACSVPDGYVADNTDCDDSNFLIHPNSPLIQWQKSLGGSFYDYASSIQQTNDGGFIVAGSSFSNDDDVTGHHGTSGYYGTSDYWIVKLDSIGSIAWQKSLGGSSDDIANSIQQTNDGGFIIAGSSGSNDGDVSGNHGYEDYWIVKLDADGNLVWQKSFGGSTTDEAYFIQQTYDDGFIIAGRSFSNGGDVSGNHGGADYWIVKLDADGSLAWQKCLGGSAYDEAQSIQQTADEGFIVAGYSFSNNGDVSGNHGNWDYWIVKLESNGNLTWQRSLGGSNADIAHTIQQISDGGFIVAGSSESTDGDVSGNHGYSDYWIVKLNADGSLVWQKSFGGSRFDNPYSIQQTTDAGFIVAGSSESQDGDVSGHHGNSGVDDYWLVKLNAGGNLEWQKSIGGSDYDVATSVKETTDGGFIAAGSSGSTDGDFSGNHGFDDYCIVKVFLPPGGIEICDGTDNNCDGNIDPLYTFYADADGDQFGNNSSSIEDCISPVGYVTDSTDCDDNNALINPAATEVCDGIDNDCDGTADDDLIFITYYTDADGDNYGDISDSGNSLCNNPGAGYSANNTDCDDANAGINPAAIEICNGIDDNCNLNADEGLIFDIYFADTDNDGFGNPNNTVDSCAQPIGFIADSNDCDDTNANVNPDATEILFNSIDDDCDGYIDEFGTDIFSSANPASVFSLFPNPTSGEFEVYLQLNNDVNSEAAIEVINLLGQVVFNKTSALLKGKLQSAIRLDDVADGIYLVRLVVSEQVYCSQIVYQK